MPDIFRADIAGEIYKGFKGQVFDVVLTKVVPGVRTPGSLTAGTNPVETGYTGEGFVDDYKEYQIDGTIIQRGDRKVVIFGASLPSGVIPEVNDKNTAEGLVRTIVNVERDPAGATYLCQSR